jgi:hypothetical protein
MESQVGDTGFEPLDATACQNKELHKPVIQSGAKSGALEAHLGDFPPDLVMVISAWPKLPETVRENIVAMVRKVVGV